MSIARASSMRLCLLVVLLAACTDDGAQLTFMAPNGPATAASYQIILANPDLVTAIANQRVEPTALTMQTVTYYLQRTTANVTSKPIPNVDGFTVRVEPSAMVSQTSFIPFVLLYGADGQLVGIGTTAPGTIFVKSDQLDRYTIAIEPVTQVADTDPVAASQAMPVDCSGQASGVVWRPAAGGELRLLFPDDPTTTDATQRPLDLDCDGHVVQPSDATADCDDSRARFYQGAPDVCDGEDTNCDDQRYIPIDCMLAACGTEDGVQLCD